jgi:hypothetical protein
MMSGASRETCWAIKKHWNHKFNYTVASCRFFLWVLCSSRFYLLYICTPYCFLAGHILIHAHIFTIYIFFSLCLRVWTF